MSVEIDKISNDEALAVWDESPQATVFTHPSVLNKLSSGVDYYLARKGHRPLCLWPVCFTDENKVFPPVFSYFVGPMWSKSSSSMPAHRWLSRSTQVYESFITLFLDEYGEIQASLPKGLQDVRVFDWWNYHDREKPRFDIRPRYTACINNLDQKDNNRILAGFRQLRRRELRNIESMGPPPRSERWETHDVIRLYKEIMVRQEIGVDEKFLKEIKSLVEIVNEGFGEIIAYEDPKKETIIAACLLLYGKKDANMVLNLVDNDWRDTGLSTLMVTESIFAAKEKGYHCYDFNGANSPNRGDDKHSYGASPILYFDINYPGDQSREQFNI